MKNKFEILNSTPTAVLMTIPSTILQDLILALKDDVSIGSWVEDVLEEPDVYPYTYDQLESVLTDLGYGTPEASKPTPTETFTQDLLHFITNHKFTSGEADNIIHIDRDPENDRVTAELHTVNGDYERVIITIQGVA